MTRAVTVGHMEVAEVTVTRQRRALLEAPETEAWFRSHPDAPEGLEIAEGPMDASRDKMVVLVRDLRDEPIQLMPGDPLGSETGAIWEESTLAEALSQRARPCLRARPCACHRRMLADHA